MNATSGSSRFLRAFRGIEQHLRRALDGSPSDSFAALVKQASKSDPVVRRMWRDLVEYAELRNAIVHSDSGDDRPIAEPHPATVERIEKMLEALSSPPSLIPRFQVEASTCLSTDRIGGAVRTMFEHDFSQMPVYADGSFVGLLTTDTVARWLGAQLKAIDLVEEAPVGEVLQFEERGDAYKFVGRTASVVDALDEFDDASDKGRRLDALLITHGGSPDQTLLGIVTAADIPALLKLLP